MPSNETPTMEAGACNHFVNIGWNNYIPAERILMVIDYNSQLGKRMRDAWKEKFGSEISMWMLDFTKGRRSHSMLLLDTQHLVISIRPRAQMYNVLNGLVVQEYKKKGQQAVSESAE